MSTHLGNHDNTGQGTRAFATTIAHTGANANTPITMEVAANGTHNMDGAVITHG